MSLPIFVWVKSLKNVGDKSNWEKLKNEEGRYTPLTTSGSEVPCLKVIVWTSELAKLYEALCKRPLVSTVPEDPKSEALYATEAVKYNGIFGVLTKLYDPAEKFPSPFIISSYDTDDVPGLKNPWESLVVVEVGLPLWSPQNQNLWFWSVLSGAIKLPWDVLSLPV